VTLNETDDDGAARWAIRLDAGPLDEAGQVELESWLAAVPRREGALLRAQATLSYLDRGRALGEPVDDRLPDDDDEPPRFSRRVVMGGLAASGIAVAATTGFLLTGREPVALSTTKGEVRQIPLADGSVATINTASSLAVQMEPQRRTIMLRSGEAWFRVAPDKARPFVVEAGETRVRAVGTAFSVRHREEGVDVLVTEGTVETWVVGHEAAARRITAGSKGFVAEKGLTVQVSPAPEVIDRALAWRSGELALDGETLSYAVHEMNRYNKRQIEIDPALADEQLVGYFRTNEPENFSHAVAATIGARIVEDGDIIHLMPSQ